jgi:hypothetical protein
MKDVPDVGVVGVAMGAAMAGHPGQGLASAYDIDTASEGRR